MPAQVVRDLRLQRQPGLRPVIEEVVQLFEFNEQVRRGANFGLGPRQRADRIDQIRRRVRMPAVAAIVARLIRRFALGTGSINEPVGQKGLFFDVELDDILVSCALML